MAVICEFGTAPDQAKEGYKMVGTVHGTDQAILNEYGGLDVRFVRGAAVHGQPGVWEFAAMHPLKLIQVPNWYADSDSEGRPAKHHIEIEDRRGVDGQVNVTVGAIEGALNDMISVQADVSTNPMTGAGAVPCLHVSFDDDALAFSLFKVGDQIILTPGFGVNITRSESPTGRLYVVE